MTGCLNGHLIRIYLDTFPRKISLNFDGKRLKIGLCYTGLNKQWTLGNATRLIDSFSCFVLTCDVITTNAFVNSRFASCDSLLPCVCNSSAWIVTNTDILT